MPAETVRRIADAVADNAGRTMIENYGVAELRARMADAPLGGAGLAAVEEARATGRPVLFVTGHYGNFEAPRAALVARGYQIGGLYRPMSNPFFNAHYARTMSSWTPSWPASLSTKPSDTSAKPTSNTRTPKCAS